MSTMPQSKLEHSIIEPNDNRLPTGETRLLETVQLKHQEGEGGSPELLLQDKHGRFRAHPAQVRCLHSHQPTVGSTLLFFQTCLHEGAPVGLNCAKYLIRADVMFERVRAPSAACAGTQADKAAFVLLQQAEAIESQSVEVDTETQRHVAAESSEGEATGARAAMATATGIERESPTDMGVGRCIGASGNKDCTAAEKQASCGADVSARGLREAAFRKSATVAALFGGSPEAAASAAVLWRTR